MSENNEIQGLGYDQVLLVPNASDVLPHTVSLSTKLAENFKLNIPLIAEAMGENITADTTLTALNGGLGVVVAHEDVEEQMSVINDVKQADVDLAKYPNAFLDNHGKLRVAAEVWLTEGVLERVEKLVLVGVDAIFLYLHGTLDQRVNDVIKDIRKTYPGLFISVGVVENQNIAATLYQSGIDAVIAGRSIDSKLPNNAFYPFLTTTMAIADVAADYGKTVIATGGVHYSGDIVKSIASGANAVIVTEMLSGQEIKKHEGSEGEMTIEDAIFQADGGLRAGMGYTGSKTIKDLNVTAQFVQITDNGLRESHPHDVEITKIAPNYAK